MAQLITQTLEPFKCCECGCGQVTFCYTTTDSRIGAVRGEPARRIKGHNPKNKPKPIGSHRLCKGCGNLLPRTLDFFFGDASHRDGLQTRCKLCVRSKNNAYESLDPERWKAYRTFYRESNSAEAKRYLTEWKSQNRDKFRQYLRDAQARRRIQIGSPVEAIDFRAVYDAHAGICGICLEPVSYADASLDHIVPLARGGAHTASNVQPAHLQCNAIKGARPLEFAQFYIRSKKLKESKRAL